MYLMIPSLVHCDVSLVSLVQSVMYYSVTFYFSSFGTDLELIK